MITTSFLRSRLVAAAAITLLSLAGAANADLVDIAKHYDCDTNTSSGIFEDTDTGDQYYWWVNHDTGEADFQRMTPGGTPGGDGSTGLAPDMEQMINDLKKLGSTSLEQADPWTMLFVMGIVDDDMGPGVIDPWDLGGFAANEYGEGAGGSGFDPNVPLDEQINRNGGGGGDDDGDDEPSLSSKVDPSSYGEYYGLNPEHVNPVPGGQR